MENGDKFLRADQEPCPGRCQACAGADRARRLLFSPPLRALPKALRAVIGRDRGFARLFRFLCRSGPRCPPTREVAARLAWMSDRGFGRRFRQAFGLSWRAFLVTWRQLSAAELVGKGIGRHDVATLVGYGSARALRRALKGS